MSIYSGKCDFYDYLFRKDDSEEEAFKKFKGTKIYKYKPISERVTVESIEDIHKNWASIEYHKIEDLIPYYPYIICMMHGDKESSKSIIVLGEESWVDREEREILEYYKTSLLRIYNRCKRKKTDFVPEEVYKNISLFSNKVILELANRVKRNGKKAAICNLHLESHQYYRRELIKLMKKHGMNPESYGYDINGGKIL